jgi:hypothetical protein
MRWGADKIGLFKTGMIHDPFGFQHLDMGILYEKDNGVGLCWRICIVEVFWGV